MRAYLADDGVYISWLAHHEVYTTNADNWFDNTNVEFFIGADQFYMNAKGDKSLGGGQGAMKTVAPEGESTLYTTTAEVFVPMQILVDTFNYSDEIGYLKMAFAFKTTGDRIIAGPHNDPINGDDWWWVDHHYPGNLREQYYVTKDGILETVDGLPSINVDGSFADWESLSNFDKIDASKLSIYDTADNDGLENFSCGYTVWSFATKHGVYVYYEARRDLCRIGSQTGLGKCVWCRGTRDRSLQHGRQRQRYVYDQGGVLYPVLLVQG